MKPLHKVTAEEMRERYLGKIGPLLDAARPLDGLSPAQTKQIQRRVLRTMFRTPTHELRSRLLPVLAALALLALGGAAFATAQRFGLIAIKRESKPTGEAPQGRAEKPRRPRRPALASSANPGPSLALPELPMEAPAATPAATPALLAPSLEVLPLPAPSAKAGTSVGLRAGESGRATSAPAVIFARKEPRSGHPTPVALAWLPPSHPIQTTPEAGTQAELPRAFPSGGLAAVLEQAPLNNGPPVRQERSALVALPPPRKPASPLAVAPPASGDQAMFGQAMRKLRWQHDPAAAYAAVQEHERIYPESSLAHERTVLAVEALLALHRNGEALGRLDALALDELPRSGERFVVRGELRAGARRWQDALADFDQALSRVAGTPAWHERALWGRGVARLRCGEREAGLADMERYRDRYPQGRFLAEANRLLAKP